MIRSAEECNGPGSELSRKKTDMDPGQNVGSDDLVSSIRPYGAVVCHILFLIQFLFQMCLLNTNSSAAAGTGGVDSDPKFHHEIRKSGPIPIAKKNRIRIRPNNIDYQFF